MESTILDLPRNRHGVSHAFSLGDRVVNKHYPNSDPAQVIELIPINANALFAHVEVEYLKNGQCARVVMFEYQLRLASESCLS